MNNFKVGDEVRLNQLDQDVWRDFVGSEGDGLIAGEIVEIMDNNKVSVKTAIGYRTCQTETMDASFATQVYPFVPMTKEKFDAQVEENFPKIKDVVDRMLAKFLPGQTSEFIDPQILSIMNGGVYIEPTTVERRTIYRVIELFGWKVSKFDGEDMEYVGEFPRIIDAAKCMVEIGFNMELAEFIQREADDELAKDYADWTGEGC